MSKKAKDKDDDRLVTSRPELPARSSTLTKVLVWLRTEVISYEVSNVVLSDASGGDPVLSLPCEPEESWCEGAASQLVAAAEADATSLNGKPVRYHIQSFNGKAVRSRCAFLVRPAETIDTGDGSGLLSQAYRHLETRDKLLNSSMANVMAANDRMLARLESMNDALMQDRDRAQERELETIRVIEQLMSKQHERDLAAVESESALAMKEGLARKLSLVADAAVAKLSGGQLQIGDGAKKSNGVQAFLESLTPEQKEAIGKTLEPEQLILLSTIAQSETAG